MKTARMELLLLLLTILTAVHAAHPRHEPSSHPPLSPCLPILLPHRPAPGRLEPGTQAILPAYKIYCHGNVTSWAVLVEHRHTRTRRNSRFDLQIWRPAPAGYRLVGVASLAGEVEEDKGRVMVELSDPSQQLSVQPGDVVGMFVGKEGVRVRTAHMPGVEVWSYRTESPASWYLNLSDERLRRNNKVPLIELTIVSLSPNSSSPPPPKCTPTTSSTPLPINIDTSTDFEALLDQCDSGGLFPVLLVLVVTLAGLLVAMLVLCIALYLVCIKMRKLKDDFNQLLNTNHSPQPLPHYLSSFVGRRESIDNPSYTQKTEAHTVMATQGGNTAAPHTSSNHTDPCGPAEYEQPHSPHPTQLGCFQLDTKTTSMQSNTSYSSQRGGGGGGRNSDSNLTSYYESIDAVQPGERGTHPHLPPIPPSLSTLPQNH